MEKIEKVDGDMVEIGVYKAATFRRLVPYAKKFKKTVWAIDSFEGMAEPTHRDGDVYPKGRLANSIENFKQTLSVHGYVEEDYKILKGFVPDILKKYSKQTAFALIDLDQYQPTLDALNHMWPLMSPKSILLLDDYFIPRRNQYASAAIDEWLDKKPQNARAYRYEDTQLYIEKTV